MLDGRRDLRTGALRLAPAAERKGRLPPRSGPRPSDAEAEREIQRAQLEDADGHPFQLYPEPLRGAYERNPDRFQVDHNRWAEAVAEDRLHASEAKRATWEREEPECRRVLGVVEAAAAPSTSGGLPHRALQAACAVLDWMRERVATARSSLGRSDLAAQELEAAWLDVLADHPLAQDAVRVDLVDGTQDLARQVRDVRGETAALFRDVERRRTTERERAAQRGNDWGPSGPGF